MTKSIAYQAYLIESLKKPSAAAAYLNAALIDGDVPTFLLALRNVVRANSSIKKLAEKIRKSDRGLEKILSKDGNPQLYSIKEILEKIGLKLSIESKQSKKAA